MRILEEVRFKMMLQHVFFIALVWAVIGGLDAMNTHAMSQTALLQPTERYQFAPYLFVNTLMWFISGLISGGVLIFYLRESGRSKTFGMAFLQNSLVLSLIHFSVHGIVFQLIRYSVGVGAVERSSILYDAFGLLGSPYYTKSVVLGYIVAAFTIVSLNVNEKYGPGMLRKMLLGNYYQPKQEERIFMFVDIKSATTIAEMLGHIRFHNLLNDFFRDVTNPILYTSGEVIQYVGDEIVVSWTMDKGLPNANCLRCFYEMQVSIQKRSERYQQRYGLVPEFKGGLHCGVVTAGEIGVIKKDVVFSGDVVNTTARIQTLCNEYNVNLLLSKYLLDKLNLPPSNFYPKRMGVTELKGKRQKIELYTFEENERNQLFYPVLVQD
ncbi:MAG: adenylate/guanylate cyclase domain-containing protein [Saprospiraceae bacterium]|nr:adenylate/guanylate cyclase domain-containing protein [Saprospiraceae bacterium]